MRRGKGYSGKTPRPDHTRTEKAVTWHNDNMCQVREVKAVKTLTSMPDNRVSSVSTEMPQRTITEEGSVNEITIEKNYRNFRQYILQCVKVTDLITHYDYFTTGKPYR